ncbi:hypothetical protein HO133_001915 [Letharia lupina]|uniref:Uncharacterized protein n=1 Tax=Letharia lupina TaxID=560253 RepID=A0A8H6FB44_9LECA|nr:uncharacterized protein HO133_001915 [Letharia lupina]KAF6221947.1 hypothetical protein HO133_001915 [Letharia lupina]
MESKSEEREVTAGLLSNNRFAVLPPKEPAPGIQEERAFTIPLDPSPHHERPITLPLQTDIPPTGQSSSSEKIKDKSLAPTSLTTPRPNRPSIPRLAPHTPAKSTRIERNQQPSAPAAASISPTKPQAQLSPLVLQTEAQSGRSSRPPSASASARISPDFDTGDPYLSLLAPQPAPALPSPPIPQDPLPDPSLATLPIHPSLDFRFFTSPKSSGPKPPQLAPPIPTSIDIFRSDDPMRRIVRTRSGKIFCIAAEIAAANKKSTMRPVGHVLVPGTTKKVDEVKGGIDRKKSDCRSGEYVDSPEEMEDESEEEGGEGEEWLGKEEGFTQGSVLRENADSEMV